jgi:uncharacterized protein YukE
MRTLPFPTATAQAAAAECRSVAQLVQDRMGAASTAAGAARATWSGVYADDFSIVWPDTETSATELVERLCRLAGDLDDAVDTAAAENRRRAGLRAQYDCERSHPNVPC